MTIAPSCGAIAYEYSPGPARAEPIQPDAKEPRGAGVPSRTALDVRIAEVLGSLARSPNRAAVLGVLDEDGPLSRRGIQGRFDGARTAVNRRERQLCLVEEPSDVPKIPWKPVQVRLEAPVHE